MHISTKCSVAVHCLVFINEYGDVKKVTSEMLSLTTGCNPVTIRSILSALKKENILTVKSGTGGAKINCPLEDINLYRIYMAVEPGTFEKLIGIHSMPSPFCPIGKNIHTVLNNQYTKIRNDLKTSLESVTLEEIIKDYHTKI